MILNILICSVCNWSLGSGLCSTQDTGDCWLSTSGDLVRSCAGQWPGQQLVSSASAVETGTSSGGWDWEGVDLIQISYAAIQLSDRLFHGRPFNLTWPKINVPVTVQYEYAFLKKPSLCLDLCSSYHFSLKYLLTSVSKTRDQTRQGEMRGNIKFKIQDDIETLRYHWSLKSFSCAVSTLFISQWSSRNIKRIWSYLSACLFSIHTCPEFHSCISLQRLPQHRDFSSIFSRALQLHHEEIFLELLRVLSPGEWLVIKLTSDPWYMILNWPGKISKKSSLIRTTLI